MKIAELNGSINRSDLIENIHSEVQSVDLEGVKTAVTVLIDAMGDRLKERGRVEIRGFGSFCLHLRSPRIGRNPKTGQSVHIPEKLVPHFKPGKALKESLQKV